MSFIDFDTDGDRDMIFYGSEKGFVIHKNDGCRFNETIDKFFFYEISNIELMKNIEDYGNIILFHSRENMLSGLASFTKYGTLQLLNTHQYDSYPDKITVGDINNDNQMEAIVYGNSFNGISLIEEKNFIIEEQKIIENKVYDFGYLLDLNFDTFKDIIILDIIDNSIKIFINGEYSDFFEERSYMPNYEINEFYTFNFDNDEFYDFIITSDDKMEIIKGDSVYSFSDKLVIEAENASQISISDFNKDGLNDIAWLDEKGDLLFSFNNKNDYSDPVKFLGGKDLFFLSETGNNKNKCCVSTNKDGTIFLFSNMINNQKAFKFTIGEAIEDFEVTGNTISLLAESGYTLAVIENFKEKLFASLSKFNINNSYDSFIRSKLLSRYLFYNVNEKLIHKIDIENNKQVSNDFYMKNDILTILNYKSGYLIISSANDSMFISELYNFDDLNDINFSFLTSDSILVPSMMQIDNEIYFWSVKNDKLFFNEFNIHDKLTKNKIEVTNSEVIFSDSLKILTRKNKTGLISFFMNNKNLSAFVFDKNIKKYNIVNDLKADKSGFGSDLIYFDGIFYLYQVDSKGKNIYTRKFVESQNVNGYFVTSFYKGKKYLVYLNKINNTINFVNIE
ncbi:MAG: hypothetical protein PVH88_02780 [Ignavibacteria bacterium]|jgi:hypothetical protein